MTKSATTRTLFALPLVAALALGACDDDPVAVEEEHGEPEGIVLVLSGQTIATFDGATRTWTGELEVAVGEETAHIDVNFTDADGDVIEFDLTDFYLQVDIDDESIAEFEQDTPGEFGGHLHGKADGLANVTFSLMHGSVGSGHADFVSAPVHAHVGEDEHDG